jgi:hypothetical protein
MQRNKGVTMERKKKKKVFVGYGYRDLLNNGLRWSDRINNVKSLVSFSGPMIFKYRNGQDIKLKITVEEL